MDLHDEDGEEEFEQLLKEIVIVTQQIPVSNNSTRSSAKKLPPPPNHHHPCKSSVAPDTRSLASAFGNLSFWGSSGSGSSAGFYQEENSLGVSSKEISNGALNRQVVFGNSLPNGPWAPISSGLDSHQNIFSSEFRSEPVSVGMESQLYSSSATTNRARIMDHGLGTSSTSPHVAYYQQYFPSSGFIIEPASSVGMESQLYSSSTMTSRAGIMNHGLGTASTAPHVAYQQRHFQSPYATPVSPSVSMGDQYCNLGGITNNNLAFAYPALVADRVIQPGILSSIVRTSDQYSNLGGTVTGNVAFAYPALAADRVIQLGIFSPNVRTSDQHSNLGGQVTGNLAFPYPILAADRIVQPGIFADTSDQHSNLGGTVTGNLAFPYPILAADRIVQPGIFSLSASNSDQDSNLGGITNDHLASAANRVIQPGIFSPFASGTDQHSNLGGEMNESVAFSFPVLAADRTVQPGIFSPPLSSRDQNSHLGGRMNDNLGFPSILGVPPSVGGNDKSSNLSGLINDNIAFARALQLQADRIQSHLREPWLMARHHRARQRARGTSVDPQNSAEHQQQQMRSHAPGQSHANRVVGTSLNSNLRPSSRGHSPTGTSAPEASLQQAANSRYFEQLWSLKRFIGQNNLNENRDRPYRQ